MVMKRMMEEEVKQEREKFARELEPEGPCDCTGSCFPLSAPCLCCIMFSRETKGKPLFTPLEDGGAPGCGLYCVLGLAALTNPVTACCVCYMGDQEARGKPAFVPLAS